MSHKDERNINRLKIPVLMFGQNFNKLGNVTKATFSHL